jgi:hypothetical protein
VSVQIKNVLSAAILGTACVCAMSASALAYQNSVTYSGQGLTADDFGGYDLTTELCGVENGADTDGPYLLWVFTATRATNADITGPWGTVPMTKIGGGTFKYISDWYDPDTLASTVSGTYDGRPTNAQLVISHGCRPFETQGAWCSPGFWGQALDGAWELIGVTRFDVIDPPAVAARFNSTVKPTFWNGDDFAADPTLNTVLNANGGTYKGAPVAGTDPRTADPNALNAFNATGAWLTDQIPGYEYDPAVKNAGGSNACPIDHHGNFKE